MAWDFSTDPEFDERLEWMRDFVREEVWPIETIEHDIQQSDLDAITAPLQEQVKEKVLDAPHEVKVKARMEGLPTPLYAAP